MNEQILWNRPQFPAQLNMSHPLTRGLVGCWLLNDTGGLRAWDSSPYGNHGLLTNFASPPKRPFNGLLFDGVNDVVNLGNAQSLQIVNKITIEIWFIMNAWTGYWILCTNGIDTFWTIRLNVDTVKIQAYIQQADDILVTAGTAMLLTTRRWYQHVSVIDGAGYQAYIDGQKDGTATAWSGAIKTTTNNILVGARSDNFGPFDGSIGLIRIWKDRALFPSEVRQLYQDPYGMILK